MQERIDAVGGSSADEIRSLLDTARRLRHEVLEPAERLLDALPDPRELAGHEARASALARARSVGIDAIALPEELGGLGASWAVSLRASEVVAAGAPGFAAQFLSEGVLPRALWTVLHSQAAPDRRVLDLLGTDGTGSARLSFAVVQPEAGAEGALSLPSGLAFRSSAHREPQAGAVEPDGNGLRCRGVRLPQVANGGACTHLLLVVGPSDRLATYLVPLEHPGVRRGAVSHRSGLRVHGHADIDLDDVLLGEADRVLGAPWSARLLEAVLHGANAGMAACAIGLASRTYDHALDYCRTRVQGGRPIIEHQSIAGVLWRAAASITVLRSALYAAGDAPDLATAVALRTVAAEVVHRVPIDMLELLGGYGVTTDYPLEKLYRDARALLLTAGFVEGPGVDAPVSLL